MSEAKHTPEPWKVSGEKMRPHGRGFYEGLYDVGVMTDIGPDRPAWANGQDQRDNPHRFFPVATARAHSAEEADANAARIVACVNACANIPDPADLRARYERAVEACRATLAEHPAENGRGVDLPQSLAAQLRAVLAEHAQAPAAGHGQPGSGQPT
jgi:hypothetical protein